LYGPSDRVLTVAQQTGAIPYDITGVELSHVGALCTFDAFLGNCELRGRALQALAVIIREADSSHLGLSPQSSGGALESPSRTRSMRGAPGWWARRRAGHRHLDAT
jgi:hypothetical protein